MIDTNKMEIQSVIKGIVTKEMNNGRTLDTAIKVSFLRAYFLVGMSGYVPLFSDIQILGYHGYLNIKDT